MLDHSDSVMLVVLQCGYEHSADFIKIFAEMLHTSGEWALLARWKAYQMANGPWRKVVNKNSFVNLSEIGARFFTSLHFTPRHLFPTQSLTLIPRPASSPNHINNPNLRKVNFYEVVRGGKSIPLLDPVTHVKNPSCYILYHWCHRTQNSPKFFLKS